MGEGEGAGAHVSTRLPVPEQQSAAVAGWVGCWAEAPRGEMSNRFYARFDEILARYLDRGFVVGITADHGMNDKTKDDGSRVFTLSMKYEGQPAEVKFMEISYTKRK